MAIAGFESLDPYAVVVSLGGLIGETAITEATKQTVKAFFGWLKEVFSNKKGKKFETAIAEDVEELQQVEEEKLALLAKAVQKLYEEDQKFREEFEKKVSELKNSGITFGQDAKGNIVVSNTIVKGDLNINQTNTFN